LSDLTVAMQARLPGLLDVAARAPDGGTSAVSAKFVDHVLEA